MISTKLVKLVGVFGGGWRNASRCERAVRLLQSRLTYLKNARPRPRVVQDLSGRVARFVSDGDVDSAFAVAERILREENTIRLHELLSESCQIVIGNLSYIRRHSDCPHEINEAVSTLALAAPWCPDLPELQIIRELFFERYGELFYVAAAEGLHGSCVNSEVAERLESMHAIVPYVTKRRMVCAIVNQEDRSLREGRSTFAYILV